MLSNKGVLRPGGGEILIMFFFVRSVVQRKK